EKAAAAPSTSATPKPAGGGLMRRVIQRWYDHRGTWHDPPPGVPDPQQWESFTDPKNRTAYRPKPGTQAERDDQQLAQQQAAQALLAQQQAQAAAQARTQQWLLLSVNTNPFLQDPAHVLYTQDTISDRFTNGKLITTLRDALKNGTRKAADVEPLM